MAKRYFQYKKFVIKMAKYKQEMMYNYKAELTARDFKWK